MRHDNDNSPAAFIVKTSRGRVLCMNGSLEHSFKVGSFDMKAMRCNDAKFYTTAAGAEKAALRLAERLSLTHGGKVSMSFAIIAVRKGSIAGSVVRQFDCVA